MSLRVLLPSEGIPSGERIPSGEGIPLGVVKTFYTF